MSEVVFSEDFEISELQRSTLDLIASGPTYEITLVRSSWERTPSGGVRPVSDENVAPQLLWFQPVITDARVVQLTEGEKVEANHVLIGRWDADIKEKDRFTLNGRKFLVIEVHMDRRYQTKAWVIDRA